MLLKSKSKIWTHIAADPPSTYSMASHGTSPGFGQLFWIWRNKCPRDS